VKSQTDVIIQKCRSKVSLDSYAEKMNIGRTLDSNVVEVNEKEDIRIFAKNTFYSKGRNKFDIKNIRNHFLAVLVFV